MPHSRGRPCDSKCVALHVAGLRRHVGSLPFLHIVASTPVTFMPLDEHTLELVGDRIRENVVALSAKSGHYLACFLDRPTDPVSS